MTWQNQCVLNISVMFTWVFLCLYTDKHLGDVESFWSSMGLEPIDKFSNIKIHVIYDQYLKYFRSISKGQILVCPHSIFFSMENVSIYCWSPSVVYYRSTCVVAQIFQTSHWRNNFSGGHCGLWGSYANSNQPISSSTECKAFSFALQLKSHNHLYPKEIWAFNSFEAKPHNNNFFYVAFFISGLLKALWFMELLVSHEKSRFWPPAKHVPVVLLQCLVTWDHCSNPEKPPSDRLYQTYFQKRKIVVFS